MLPKDRKTRPNRRCSAGDIIGCLLAHAGIVLVLYLLISIIFANWYVQVDSDRLSILQIVYRNYQVPGGWGQSLRRFRDLQPPAMWTS